MSTAGTSGVDNNADEINDNDRNEQFLRKLRQQNELRRQRLRETLSEYDQELKTWKESAVDDSPKFNLARPPLEEHFIALEVEWELLQEMKDQTFEKSLVNIASIFPDFPQSKDRPSDAVVQQCLLHEFSEEVIDSYHDLAETHATISKVLERETAKLELKRTFLQQQQKLLAELQEQLQHCKQKEEKQETSSSNNKTAQDQEDQVSRLKQQHQWIRQELHYVTQKLLATMENTDNNQPIMQVDKVSKPKTRKRTKRGTGQQQSDQDHHNSATTESSTKDAMEEIIYQLLQRLLEDPSNPYMLVGEDSNTRASASATATANNNQERDRRRKEIITMLIECGVVLPHDDDNEEWIRLTDYQS